MISRRDLLRRIPLISFASAVPGFIHQTLRGSEPDRDGRILVVIQLDGGNDGINTVVPYKDDGYKKHRRDLRLPSNELIKLDERTGIGLNPAMKAWAKLFEDGQLAVIHGVGYPNPSRSHFESMAVWQSAQPSDSSRGRYGWLGRGLDTAPARRRFTRGDLPGAVGSAAGHPRPTCDGDGARQSPAISCSTAMLIREVTVF